MRPSSRSCFAPSTRPTKLYRRLRRSPWTCRKPEARGAVRQLFSRCAVPEIEMVFDLGKAMRKKEEFESARLADFEFRQRARTFRLMAEKIGHKADEARIVAMTARMNDDA